MCTIYHLISPQQVFVASSHPIRVVSCFFLGGLQVDHHHRGERADQELRRLLPAERAARPGHQDGRLLGPGHYPLVICCIAMENHRKTIGKWWFNGI